MLYHHIIRLSKTVANYYTVCSLETKEMHNIYIFFKFCEVFIQHMYTNGFWIQLTLEKYVPRKSKQYQCSVL
jgi:hypothetical protein